MPHQISLVLGLDLGTDGLIRKRHDYGSDNGLVEGLMKSRVRESSLTLHSFRPTRSWEAFSTWGWMPALAPVF